MAEDKRENAMHVIAVDAMGGDNAPQAIVEGVNQAIADFKDIEIQLYGDEAKIKNFIDNLNSWGHIMNKEDSAD